MAVSMAAAKAPASSHDAHHHLHHPGHHHHHQQPHQQTHQQPNQQPNRQHQNNHQHQQPQPLGLHSNSSPPSDGSTSITTNTSAGRVKLPPLSAPKFEPGNFTLLRTLGTGTFARVCLVRPAGATSSLEEDPTAEVYALKVLRKADVVKLKQIDHVRHERAVLASVAGHPFITTLRASFADRDSLYILFDYVPGGELFSYLRKLRRFDEPVARFYVAEIVLVLEFLHEHQGGIAYRDLKPENLLLDRDGHVKLVDFGFAKRLGRPPYSAAAGPETARCSVETYTLCGTPEYLAPEVIHNEGHTTAVDWWALGILLYEFLTGYPPFWHQNPMEIYKQIVEKPVSFHRDPPVSRPAQDLILSLCTADRSRRLGISGGAARVKAHPFFRHTDWDAVLHRRNPGPILPPVRYPGDAQCFDLYPDDDPRRAEYTDDMARQYDHYFADF